MPATSLQRIADNMIAAVAASPLTRAWTSQVLSGGLEIVYSRDGDTYRLALRRDNVFPSDKEINILASVFDVPPGVPLNTYTRRLPGSVSGRPVTSHVIEYVWRCPAPEPEPVPETLSEQPA